MIELDTEMFETNCHAYSLFKTNTFGLTLSNILQTATMPTTFLWTVIVGGLSQSTGPKQSFS